ncbi:hypothetical protein MT418_004846 [Batrachochytrium dendrobatidis]
MSPVTMPSDGGPDYTETLSLIQDGNDALANLESQQTICDDQYSSRRERVRLAEKTLQKSFWNLTRQIWTDSERASTSGTQGSSRSHGPPPSYKVVMRKPKLYKVIQQNPGDQLPSYQEVMNDPQKFPEVLEDPDVTESSSMSPSIVHPTQASSSVPSSQHTALSTLRRVASSLQRAASSVRKVSSSLTWKVDRS